MQVPEGGEKLRKWRERKGLTLRDFQKQSGFQMSQVSAYENGKSPGLKVAYKLEVVTKGAVKMQDWVRLDKAHDVSEKKGDIPCVTSEAGRKG